jgi:WD40 repeat protein
LDIIVTADIGEDSMLVVWDVNTGTPRKTIFNPHPDGILALDINEDGTLIVSLSKSAKPTEQQVTLWRWQEEEPSYITAKMDEKVDCMQRFVKFNHNQN